jgi:hypothetical protein
VFLMETRLSVSLEWLRVTITYEGVAWGWIGMAMGEALALLWDSSVSVHIQSYSDHHINAEIVHQMVFHGGLHGFLWPS